MFPRLRSAKFAFIMMAIYRHKKDNFKIIIYEIIIILFRSIKSFWFVRAEGHVKFND